ncbi:hypothetical protein D3C84_849460 [compost metagenome]
MIQQGAVYGVSRGTFGSTGDKGRIEIARNLAFHFVTLRVCDTASVKRPMPALTPAPTSTASMAAMVRTTKEAIRERMA